MDHISPQTSVTSPMSILRTPASKQPTYTTAGTIYNPNASQPLQPPTRRGRSFKWSNGGTHTDLALLPKSVLATLPLRGFNSRTPILQQYSPLQQNYDRAISPSPFQDTDCLLAKMPDQGLLEDSGNASNTLSTLFAGSSEDRSVNDGWSDVEDSDSDFGTDPLMGMTVKSLQNLASYPNPNQKRARKALLGAKPNLIGMGMPGRNLVSPKPNAIRPIGSPPKSDTLSSDAVIHVAQGTSSLRRIQASTRGESESGRQGPPGLLAAAAAAARVLDPKPGPSALSDGPGAPRPLTAGPPGQRQYRPSTFESTFKALQTKSQQSNEAGFGDDSHRSSRDTCVQAGMNEWHPSTSSSTVVQAGEITTCPIHPATRGSQELLSQEEKPSGPGAIQRSHQPSVDSSCENEPLDYKPLPDEPWIPSLRDPRPENRPRFQSDNDRLSAAELRARDERTERFWSSGTGILDKTPADTMVDASFRKLERSLGVIGDRRPLRNKTQPHPLSIEKANKMTPAEHAKPLLNMAFASLVRYTEENGTGPEEEREGE